MMKLAVDDQMKPAITAEVARALRLLAEAEPEIQALITIEPGNHRSDETHLEDLLSDLAMDSITSLFNRGQGTPVDAFVEAALLIARRMIAAKAKPEASIADSAAATRPPATSPGQANPTSTAMAVEAQPGTAAGGGGHPSAGRGIPHTSAGAVAGHDPFRNLAHEEDQQ